MSPPKTVTTSEYAVKPRLSAAERRAAQVAAIATQQSELKQDAAERRRARDLRDGDGSGADGTGTPPPAG